MSENDENLERNFFLNNEPKDNCFIFWKDYLFLLVSLCLQETSSVFSVRGNSWHFFLRQIEYLMFLPFPTKTSDHKNVGTYLSYS